MNKYVGDDAVLNCKVDKSDRMSVRFIGDSAYSLSEDIPELLSEW